MIIGLTALLIFAGVTWYFLKHRDAKADKKEPKKLRRIERADERAD